MLYTVHECKLALDRAAEEVNKTVNKNKLELRHYIENHPIWEKFNVEWVEVQDIRDVHGDPIGEISKKSYMVGNDHDFEFIELDIDEETELETLVNILEALNDCYEEGSNV